METSSSTLKAHFDEKFAQKCKENFLECNICQEPYTDPQIIKKCFHAFCADCISRWMQSRQTCPNCMVVLTKEDLQHDFDKFARLEAIWEKLAKKMKLESEQNPYREVKKVLIKPQEASTSFPALIEPQVTEVHPALLRPSSQPQLGNLHQAPYAPCSLSQTNAQSFDQAPFNHFYQASYPAINTPHIPAYFPSIQEQSPNTAFHQPTLTPLLPANFSKDKAKKISVSMDSYKGKNKPYISIDARDGIKVSGCKVFEHTSTSMGKLRATDCVLHNIKARDGAVLTNTTFKDAKVAMGTFTATFLIANLAAVQGGSIEARDGIKLENMHCAGNISTSMGFFTAENCILNNIKARDGITLKNSRTAEINSSMGKITAVDCTMQSTTVRDGAELTNCQGTTVSAPMGKIRAKNFSTESKFFTQLEARDGIELENMLIEKAISTQGPVNAVNSRILSSVECHCTLALTHSSVGKATLKGAEEICITLVDGLIEGDLIIEVETTGSNSGMCSVVQVGGYGNNIHISNSSYFGGQQVIQINGMRYVQKGNSISISGVSYPLTSRDRQNLQMCNPSELEISASGHIISSRGKAVTINGKPLSSFENASVLQNPLPIILKIKGTGKIGGNICFKGGTGDVLLADGIVHTGRIIC